MKILLRGAAAQSLKMAIFGPFGRRKTGKNKNFKKLYNYFLKVTMGVVYGKLHVILMKNENLHKLFPKFWLKFGHNFNI